MSTETSGDIIHSSPILLQRQQQQQQQQQRRRGLSFRAEYYSQVKNNLRSKWTNSVNNINNKINFKSKNESNVGGNFNNLNNLVNFNVDNNNTNINSSVQNSNNNKNDYFNIDINMNNSNGLCKGNQCCNVEGDHMNAEDSLRRHSKYTKAKECDHVAENMSFACTCETTTPIINSDKFIIPPFTPAASQELYSDQCGNICGDCNIANLSPLLTVVFDLDETLVYARGGPLYVRPGVELLMSFLKANRDCVESVVWTSSIKEYAEAVIAHIDPDHVISHVICRDERWLRQTSRRSADNLHERSSVTSANVLSEAKLSECKKLKEGQVNKVKDLTLLGRDLNSVLIIENTPDSVIGFESNALLVSDYDGGELADDTLRDLTTLLQNFINKKKRDVAIANDTHDTTNVKEIITVPNFLQNAHTHVLCREVVNDKGGIMPCFCLLSSCEYCHESNVCSLCGLTECKHTRLSHKHRSRITSRHSGRHVKVRKNSNHTSQSESYTVSDEFLTRSINHKNVHYNNRRRHRESDISTRGNATLVKIEVNE